MASALEVSPELMTKTRAFSEQFMSQYDGSHDFEHIRRVLSIAHRIQATVPNTSRSIITLCVLLHDVGDKKYLVPGQNPKTIILETLCSFNASTELAQIVQTICSNVSYSNETKDEASREHVRLVVEKYPELGVVQDADRLDAIGMVGAGRCFMFGGAKNRTLAGCVDHFKEKLVNIEGMMKTGEGKKLARERTARIEKMLGWWEDEVSGVDNVVEGLGTGDVEGEKES